MKPSHISKTQMQGNNQNHPVVLRKVSVNPSLSPFNRLGKKPDNRLSILGYELRKWLEHLTGSNGVYFLDLGNVGRSNYTMHFKHNATGKLMELDHPEELNQTEDSCKEFLEALMFDLSLFPEEPILVFDGDLVETQLTNLAGFYYEYAKEIDCIIGRLVNLDIKSLFEQCIYMDSRVQELSVDGIYHAIFPGSSISFKKSNASYGLYLILTAVQSVFYQVIAKKVMA